MENIFFNYCLGKISVHQVNINICDALRYLNDKKFFRYEQLKITNFQNDYIEYYKNINYKGIFYVHQKVLNNCNLSKEFYGYVYKLIENPMVSFNKCLSIEYSLLYEEWFIKFLNDVLVLCKNEPYIGFYTSILKNILSVRTYQIDNNLKGLVLEILKNKPDLSSYNLKDFGNKSCSILHHLIWKFDYNFLDNVLQYKDDCNINVNKFNSDGLTPLHLAAKNALKKEAFVLIKHGASINELTNNGKSVIQLLEESHKKYRFPCWENSDNSELINFIKQKSLVN